MGGDEAEGFVLGERLDALDDEPGTVPEHEEFVFSARRFSNSSLRA